LGFSVSRTLWRQASGSFVLSVHALLFTDVVDSTLLTQRLGDARARSLWALHDRGAREALRRHRGREIDRSDGFFLLFDRAADAARYALDYHALLATLEMTAKVGLHVGEVTLRDIPADEVAQGAKRIEVEGLAKPVAARVMTLARGGQTLLSEAARAALHDALDAGQQIESHGHYRLKGVDEPVEVFELGARDRCSFTPPHDTDKAYRVVRSGGLWRALREVRHNLPAERDAFIGRGTGLTSLTQMVWRDARFLSRLVVILARLLQGHNRLRDVLAPRNNPNFGIKQISHLSAAWDRIAVRELKCLLQGVNQLHAFPFGKK
jgi:class 3 adenylate cyclase